MGIMGRAACRILIFEVKRGISDRDVQMKTPKSPWPLAAGTAIVVAVVEAATLIHVVPGTTTVDTGALPVTGFLAGLFMGFHLAHQAGGTQVR